MCVCVFVCVLCVCVFVCALELKQSVSYRDYFEFYKTKNELQLSIFPFYFVLFNLFRTKRVR